MTRRLCQLLVVAHKVADKVFIATPRRERHGRVAVGVRGIDLEILARALVQRLSGGAVPVSRCNMQRRAISNAAQIRPGACIK